MRSNSSATRPSSHARYASLMLAAMILTILLWPWAGSSGDRGKGSGVTPACARWDEPARQAISRLVDSDGQDSELRRASEAIFLLRRARRNCAAGWTLLACQDYVAVIRGVAVASGDDRAGCAMAAVA